MKKLLALLLLALLPVSVNSNDFFNASGVPSTGAALVSATIRTEFANIGAGFDKLPTLTGNGSKAVIVNSGGTALTVTTGTLTLAGNFATSGSSALTLTTTGATNVTLPTTGTLSTLAGSETLTGKTLTSPVINGTVTTTGLTMPALTMGGNLLFTDATYDIGASGATRPRDFFLSRNATIGGTLGVTGKITTTTAGIDVPTSALGTVYSDTYTPSVTATTNVAASTPRLTQYMRVGNIVWVAGNIEIDPTAATTTSFSLALPVSSNLANAYELGGSGFANGSGAVIIYGDVSNNYAYFEFTAVSTSNQTLSFSFGYLVI